MIAKAVEIQVQDDHLARRSQTRNQILALAQLIRNAVHTEALRVDLTLVNNDLDGLVAVKVEDYARGTLYSQAEVVFPRLGES